MNGNCRRFASEGFERLEAGASLDGHFQTCADCLNARRVFDTITAALAEGPHRRGPPLGWQDQLLQRVRAAEPRRRPRRLFTLLPALAAAAGVALVAWALWPSPPPVLALTADVVSVSKSRHRNGLAPGAASPGPVPGDRWALRANGGGFRNVELRVFRDRGVLVLRCPAAAPSSGCRRDGDWIEASVTVAPGRYEAYMAASDSPLPPPALDLGADLDRLAGAGARVETVPPLLIW